MTTLISGLDTEWQPRKPDLGFDVDYAGRLVAKGRPVRRCPPDTTGTSGKALGLHSSKVLAALRAGPMLRKAAIALIGNRRASTTICNLIRSGRVIARDGYLELNVEGRIGDE